MQPKRIQPAKATAIVSSHNAESTNKPDMSAIIAASIARHQKTLDKLADR